MLMTFGEWLDIPRDDNDSEFNVGVARHYPEIPGEWFRNSQLPAIRERNEMRSGVDGVQKGSNLVLSETYCADAERLVSTPSRTYRGEWYASRLSNDGQFVDLDGVDFPHRVSFTPISDNRRRSF